MASKLRPVSPLLLNAARAFAMVSFADGKVDPTESRGFGDVARAQPELGKESEADIAYVWAVAAKEVHAAPSFGPALTAIRAETTDEASKQMLMRVAQAAIVADKRIEPQEGSAIRLLAEALGLDPAAY